MALGEVVTDALERLAEEIDERGVEVQIAADLPMVVADRARLLKVLHELLANGVKFLGDQPAPRIEVGQRNSGPGLVFFVRDNGLGIAAEYQEKIFGLFDRLDSAIPGTGVGLTLARRVVEMHGGRIWVESAGPGCGSTFCFTLSGEL